MSRNRERPQAKPARVIVCGTDRMATAPSQALLALLGQASLSHAPVETFPLLKVVPEASELSALHEHLANVPTGGRLRLVVTSQSLLEDLAPGTPIGQEIQRLGAGLEIGGVGVESSRELEAQCNWQPRPAFLAPPSEPGLSPLLRDYESLLTSGKAPPLVVLGARGGISQNLVSSFETLHPHAKVMYFACYRAATHPDAPRTLENLLSSGTDMTQGSVFIVRSGQSLRILASLLSKSTHAATIGENESWRLLIWGESTRKALDDVTLPSWLHPCENP